MSKMTPARGHGPAREHGCQKCHPYLRAVLVTSVFNTAREHGCHFGHPCSWAVDVNTGIVCTELKTANWRGRTAVRSRIAWPQRETIGRQKSNLRHKQEGV